MNQLVEMYGNDVELMGDPEAFELYGEGLDDLDGEQVALYGDDGEFLGFSLIKSLKKAGSKVAAATKYVAKSPGRIAAVALAPVTGGASLLTMKAVRKPIVRTATATGNVIAKGAAAVASNKLVQKVTGNALRAGAAYATGGGSELAFNAAKMLQSTKKSPGLLAPKPVGAAPARTFAPKSFMPKRETTIRVGPTGASIETAPTGEKPGLSPAIMIGGGVAAVGLLAVMMMGKKK